MTLQEIEAALAAVPVRRGSTHDKIVQLLLELLAELQRTQ